MPSTSKDMKQSKPAQAALPRSGRPATPPDSPTAQLSNPLEFARQVIDTVKLIQTSDSKEASLVARPQIDSIAKDPEPIIRASKLEVKEVHEVWDSKAYEYKIVESPPTVELTNLDAFVFVVRTRVEKTTLRQVVYVDIKSGDLRDALRIVLKDIPWVSLNGDKPVLEQSMLFHYLPELEAHQASAAVSSGSNGEALAGLDLLVNTVKRNYQSTTESLIPLLEDGKITYDLLWALFKANCHVVSTCHGSGKPRCLRFEMGEEKKTIQGVEYFELQCQYLDFDGKVFGAVTDKLAIEKFRGARQINSLDIFPIQFHLNSEIRESLAARGEKFVSLIGSHHCHYHGHAFFQRKEGVVRVPVSSRIVIDAEQFRKSNPSYPRLFTQSSGTADDMFFGLVSATDEADSKRVKSIGVTGGDLCKDDLLICSPTVLAFSLGDKFWGEYAVDDIRSIEWSTLPFDCLTIPAKTKEVIVAVAQKHLGHLCKKGRSSTPNAFDDVVKGKGRGINILLHGPPGVGKTLTAEAISEHFYRPLYSISTGELSSDAAELEAQLTHIFQTASAWNALLLLDEADVFLQRRAELTLERNRLVAVFLRKLEYYDGVLFLTTNLVQHFDDAILNRIHLMMRYDKLEKEARKTIFNRFLETTNGGRGLSDIRTEYVDRFACVLLNGRQIKHTIAIATALAAGKDEILSSAHISQALVASGHFIPASSDTLDEDSLYD